MSEITVKYATLLVVRAKDGTDRCVPVCPEDEAREIGERVIEAIHGTRLYQIAGERFDPKIEGKR